MKTCQNPLCQAPNIAGATYCRQCGRALPRGVSGARLVFLLVGELFLMLFLVALLVAA